VSPIDPRLAAFCDAGPSPAGGPEVFTAVVYGSQVFGDDPFDVESLHAEARAAFRRLLDRASSWRGPTPASASELPPNGKTLLLLGEAGSGKTHLMRAFRAHAHAHGHGYCGYLQMTSRADNYARYVLANLIDSLDQPYLNAATGLSRLARGVLDAVTTVTQAEREALVDGGLEPEALARLIHQMSRTVVRHPRFTDVDIDLVRVLMYLLVDDGLVHALAIKWLRCEELSRYDREVLGDLVPRTGPEMPLRTIVGLGRLMWAVHSAGLVLLVDQIEEVVELSRRDEVEGAVLRGAINTLVDVADAVPNAVVVVACLEDLFAAARRTLPGPKLDRLEHDPQPVQLVANRTADEVEALVARRMEVLLDEHGIEVDGADPTFPFAHTDLAPLAGLRTRDVLDWCRRHRERCVGAGQWVDPHPVEAAVSAGPPGQPEIRPEEEYRLGQMWNDFLAEWAPQSTLAESTMAELIGWVVAATPDEAPGLAMYASVDGPIVSVAAVRGGEREEWLVAVCEGSSRGGALARRIEEVAERARGRPVAFVRSTPFPRDPKTVIAGHLTALCRPVGPGRRVVVENADWRAMEAFRTFHDLYHDEPGFMAWIRGDRPLTRIRAVRAVLDLDRLGALADRLEPGETLTPPPPAHDMPATGPIQLGTGRAPGPPGPVRLDPDALLGHAAFLGSASSGGPTTAALVVAEGLLLRGIPVLMVDRQGDLCRYADPEAWREPEPDPLREARREELRARISVDLFTPGSVGGRPLVLPLAPPELHRASESDRDQIASYAASALGGLMGYRTRSHEPRRGILERAIAALAVAQSGEVTVPRLESLIRERDPLVLAETMGVDDRHFEALADDLQTAWLRHRRLLDGTSQGLRVLLDGMLEPEPGDRVPLTIVTTRFLGDEAAADFWVSLLLLAIEHWRAEHDDASDALRAVVLLDDADKLLPATGRAPTSRAALANLLARGRSAGLGVMLVSRSPGDLDDRCREQVQTWVVGQVKERSAMARLSPMLEAAGVDPGVLPSLAPGQFHLVRAGAAQELEAELSLLPPRRTQDDLILRLAGG
jgi:hypothetical protein